MNRSFYAHTLNGSGPENWELLDDHSAKVAAKAGEFAGAFAAAAWGELLGRCHDLGKGSEEFQSYLKTACETASEESAPGRQRVNHSTFGAQHVVRSLKVPFAGELLAYCIAGHHAGLPDADSDDDASQRSTLRYRLEDADIPKVLCPCPDIHAPTLPTLRAANQKDLAFSLAFFTRMLFSCLVDADRLCTERFCAPEQAQERLREQPAIAELRTALFSYLDQLSSKAQRTPVNLQRAYVLQRCREFASAAPGFFSLQVPTGGGKTLSSLAFAFEHAALNKLRHVIVAIPFTSILEQTADVYREALWPLGACALIEHHSNLRPENDTRSNRMAAENWDAPLVLTTNVQVFESLFAAKGTPCRKLHRLAKSVIVLDEAQTLPVELLQPTLRALRELVLNYGCTVVLCTATQPALERREEFPEGIENVRAIIPDAAALFDALKRVEVRRLGGKQTLAAIADRLAAEPQVLSIVNTRGHAAALYTLVVERAGAEGCFHLSTLMCGAHRRTALVEIRRRLHDRSSCRVVSTQLVEAGVDLDFPVVYRAEAGFDSIAQAAGRCNREGAMPSPGRTYVFEFEQPPPPGFLRDSAQSARELWAKYPDPLSPAATEAYFRHHYWRSADLLDKKQILGETSIDYARRMTRFQFRKIADKYRIIEDGGLPILIPWNDEARKLLDLLQCGHVPFVSQRELQPYLVSVPERTFQRLEQDAVVQRHESGVGLLLRPDAYSPDRGLRLEEMGLDERAWSV